jgi:hypothetical protein
MFPECPLNVLGMFLKCSLNVLFSLAVVKQLKLARSLARGMVDHSLKPECSLNVL